METQKIDKEALRHEIREALIVGPLSELEARLDAVLDKHLPSEKKEEEA